MKKLLVVIICLVTFFTTQSVIQQSTADTPRDRHHASVWIRDCLARRGLFAELIVRYKGNVIAEMQEVFGHDIAVKQLPFYQDPSGGYTTFVFKARERISDVLVIAGARTKGHYADLKWIFGRCDEKT